MFTPAGAGGVMTNNRNHAADPVARAIACDWMRAAVDDVPKLATGETAVACWNCDQWRPDACNNANARPCPTCGADYVPF